MSLDNVTIDLDLGENDCNNYERGDDEHGEYAYDEYMSEYNAENGFEDDDYDIGPSTRTCPIDTEITPEVITPQIHKNQLPLSVQQSILSYTTNTEADPLPTPRYPRHLETTKPQLIKSLEVNDWFYEPTHKCMSLFLGWHNKNEMAAMVYKYGQIPRLEIVPRIGMTANKAHGVI